jgi:hypothetical protein
MPENAHTELDERLTELERDLGPALRSVYRGSAIGSGFRNELGDTLAALEARPRPLLQAVRRRAWAAVAAVVVGGLALSVALFANQPQAVSASDVLDGLQTEAIGVDAAVGGPGCGPSGPAGQTTGGVIAIQTGPNPSSGPTTVGNATDLSDRLAAALGVSGLRVREAMLATMRAEMPPVPPDPMTGIAKQLGLSTEQVCAAFFNAPGSSVGFVVSNGRPTEHLSTAIGVNGKTVINLGTVTAEQLQEPAQKLGVSPDRLLAALKASAPPTPTSPPPSPDEIIRSFARQLGMSEDKVRGAMTQVEGKGGFYFAVPIPGLSH